MYAIWVIAHNLCLSARSPSDGNSSILGIIFNKRKTRWVCAEYRNGLRSRYTCVGVDFPSDTILVIMDCYSHLGRFGLDWIEDKCRGGTTWEFIESCQLLLKTKARIVWEDC